MKYEVVFEAAADAKTMDVLGDEADCDKAEFVGEQDVEANEMAEDVMVGVKAVPFRVEEEQVLPFMAKDAQELCEQAVYKIGRSATAAKALVQHVVTEDGQDLVEQARAEDVKVSVKAVPFVVDEEQAVPFMAKDAQDLREQAVYKKGRSAKAAKDWCSMP